MPLVVPASPKLIGVRWVAVGALIVFVEAAIHGLQIECVNAHGAPIGRSVSERHTKRPALFRARTALRTAHCQCALQLRALIDDAFVR